MYNSIQCFAENIIKKSGKILENIFNGTSSAVDLTQAIMEELNTLGCNLLAEAYETIDQMLIESPVRLKKWTIEKGTNSGSVTEFKATENGIKWIDFKLCSPFRKRSNFKINRQ